ncbi:hypothetical protein ASPWEDRAFT_26422 [Aspergillus wentii DTO 134E9]|uniref:Uncharacterized protein n=1 Tax=Aspergillus wentii DTO 134E9 TaxID=1073089 RepID=A0A1L9RPZ7_ASPWE|nr:uncharacterized protein ASPWEDRAFT_26422 [Aspergillus wentii DTO 134E9]KAI9923875.1 hypothetical protein MW887_008180 [Aspergillus wentii]OJJ36994.1 hypothetical protein ASPWEDRAFT_26422 [Aspergillus wentii DTO 134E9]
MSSLYTDSGKGFSSEMIDPAVLVLAGQSIVNENASTPLYQINRDVTAIPQKGSSVIFERIDNIEKEEHNQHIFYLAHPPDAQYRNDTPAYYITSVSSETLGNIVFETAKSRLQKTEFKALLSAKKTASDKPLFDDRPQLLFTVKPKWPGSQYKWTDADGKQIALEDKKGDQQKLSILVSMEQEMRDALVAMWVLRIWHDTAESRKAKREALDSMAPPVPYISDMKLMKRTGALGAVGGGGA